TDLEFGGSDETESHALVIIGANNTGDLAGIHSQLKVDPAQKKFGEVDLLASARGVTLGNGKEHFGFKDGLSQPVPQLPRPDGWSASRDGQVVAPGEFVVGQPDESGAPST